MLRPSPNHGTQWLPNDDDDEWIMPSQEMLHSSKNVGISQGSKFAVATVANAIMFCHLLPGCSSGSKHLLLP